MLAKQVESKSAMFESKINVCPPQAKKMLLFGSKIMKCAQFGASESGVGSRNQVLARLIPTPGSEQVLACANTWPISMLAIMF